MNKKISIIAAATLLFAACNKDPKNAPTPDEQELITTLKINVSDSAGFNKSFVYKVENGFGSGGTIVIDTMKLSPNKSYWASLTVLNEKAIPTEDITTEIIEKSEEHLFVFESKPASGAGSISITEGNKDNKGLAFNQSFKINTDAKGNGNFQVILLHAPTDKNGTNQATAGGETDLDASFPVVIE